MKQVSEIPKEGQFVAVWEANGTVWSDTYKVEKGVAYWFNDHTDEFEETSHLKPPCRGFNEIYFVIEEE